MVLECAVEVLMAAIAEWLRGTVRQLLVESAEEALIVDAHGLQEDHLELLTVTTQLRCQPVTL